MNNTAVTTTPTASRWHQDWQNPVHAELFDTRNALSDRALISHYEAFNDVRMLGEALSADPRARVVEVGCATGELYRYLKRRFPCVRYAGMDLSRVAVERARQKYPKAAFHINRLGASLEESFRSCGLPDRAEIVYSKDVVHHQTDPFGFLGQLLDRAAEAVVVRLRTRDSGETVMDPELSCQYHYDGWMPYLVLNLQQTIDFVRRRLPRAEVIVQRNHMVLGGKENRYLPKECYLPQTGTAETAMAVRIETDHPGRVCVEDKPDMRFPLPWHARWRSKP